MLRGSGMFRHTPRISESGLVNVGFEELVDLSTQGNIFPVNNFFDNHRESEGSVTDPSVEMVWVNGVRASNDDPSLTAKMFGSDDNRAREVSRPTNLYARRAGSIGSDVGQETRFRDRRLFRDVQLYGSCSLSDVSQETRFCDRGLDGRLSEDIRGVGEHESRQQQSKAPHDYREREELSGRVDRLMANIILVIVRKGGVFCILMPGTKVRLGRVSTLF
jgi:hypothetical protein